MESTWNHALRIAAPKLFGLNVRKFFKFGPALAGLYIAVAVPVYGQSLALTEALSRAEKTSASIVEAQAGVSAARARAFQAGALPNPELQVTIENLAGTGPFRGVSGAELTVGVAQRFERGGKSSARRAVAASELEVAELRLLVARADLGLRVRETYADLAAAEDRLALSSRNAGLATRLAAVAQALVSAGRDPPLRSLRARSAATQAEAARLGAQVAVDSARRALTSIIGAPTLVLTLAGGGDAPPPSGREGTGDALDVRIALAALHVAQARVQLENTVGVSDVTGQVGVRRLNETRDTALVVGFAMPLAIRDRNRGGVAASRAEVQAAEARLKQARIDATRALLDARSRASAAETQVVALQISAIFEAREAVRLAELGYRAGKFGIVDVLDAQRALNDAENALVDARLARSRAQAALARAMVR